MLNSYNFLVTKIGIFLVISLGFEVKILFLRL